MPRHEGKQRHVEAVDDREHAIRKRRHTDGPDAVQHHAARCSHWDEVQRPDQRVAENDQHDTCSPGSIESQVPLGNGVDRSVCLRDIPHAKASTLTRRMSVRMTGR